MISIADINSRLGFRDFPFAHQEYAAAMYDAFMNPETLVFLDTNVLSVPFRMPSEARRGFFKILESAIAENRLFIPGWVCNEYFFNGVLQAKNSSHHGFSSDAIKSIGNIPSGKVVKGFVAQAASSQEIDSLAEALGVTAGNALQELGAMLDRCRGMIDAVGKDRAPDVVHQELMDSLESQCLSLDFGDHISLIEEQAARRRSNRIPPGLTDEGKASEKRGASSGNVDGDLAIWLEILDRSQTIKPMNSDHFKCTMVICEEKKSDFVYSPLRRKIDEGTKLAKQKNIPNTDPSITLIDPRLVSEFEARIGHRNIAFVRLEHIASGLSGATPGIALDPDVRSFILAYQQQAAQSDKTPSGTTQTEGELTNEESGDIQPPPSPRHAAGPDQAVAELAIPAEAMSSEKAYADSLPEPHKSIAADLYSHNWYVQNPAILDLIKAGIPDSIGAAFIVGRATLQAADGSAWRADRFLLDFDEWAVDATTPDQAFLAGAAYECCFDGRGVERASFKTDCLPLILRLLSSEKWSQARKFFLSKTARIRDRFWWLPDQPLPDIRIEVAIVEIDEVLMIDSLTAAIDGKPPLSLLASREPPAGSPIMFEEARVRARIKKETLVPAEMISFVYRPAEPYDYVYLKDDVKLNLELLCTAQRPMQ